MAMVARCLNEDDAGIAEAVRVLGAGGVIVMPTDTLYGLGADATNEAAIARVFAIKGRVGDKPLLVLAADARAVEREIRLSPAGQALAESFWPGPLTLIGERLSGATLARGLNPSGTTIGVRVPDRALTRALIRAFGRPICAPSANLSGEPPARDAIEALAALGALVDLVLDGGPSEQSLPSSIVDCSGAVPILVRDGAIPRTTLIKALEPLHESLH